MQTNNIPDPNQGMDIEYTELHKKKDYEHISLF